MKDIKILMNNKKKRAYMIFDELSRYKLYVEEVGYDSTFSTLISIIKNNSNDDLNPVPFRIALVYDDFMYDEDMTFLHVDKYLMERLSYTDYGYFISEESPVIVKSNKQLDDNDYYTGFKNLKRIDIVIERIDVLNENI